MKESTRLERDNRDIEINHRCTGDCLHCEKYKTVKEADKLCEVRRARGRIADRMRREYYKEHNKDMGK